MKTTFYICLLLALSSCGSRSAVQIECDVAYGDDPLQKMDICLVAGRDASTPLVVLVHGGGWMAGDKADADFMRDALRDRGINTVNINYRLGREGIHYQQMMEDIGLAMDHVLACAGQWNIRRSKFVFWGGSAGAHLSLLYAYAYDKNDLVSLVITLGAPTKFDSLTALEGAKSSDIEGLLPIVTGKAWSADTTQLDAAYRLASPYYASKLKPTLLVHGGADEIVPLRQSELMDRRLREAGVADSLIVLPGGGHGGENTPREVSESLNRTMYEWILKYSK